MIPKNGRRFGGRLALNKSAGTVLPAAFIYYSCSLDVMQPIWFICQNQKTLIALRYIRATGCVYFDACNSKDTLVGIACIIGLVDYL
ncbi:MAG: hypothetical protein U1F46_15760 [Marinagarivorans sp.]